MFLNLGIKEEKETPMPCGQEKWVTNIRTIKDRLIPIFTVKETFHSPILEHYKKVFSDIFYSHFFFFYITTNISFLLNKRF